MTSLADTRNAQDTTPWFRQFWPWFVISIPAATVCACVVTITIAVTTADALVVEKGRGVDVQTDEFLRQEQRARELGVRANLSVDSVSGALILVTERLPVATIGPTLHLEFAHPTMADRDFSLALTPTAEENTHTAFLPSRLNGRWYVSLEQAGDWRITGILDGDSSIRLDAVSVGR